MSAGIYGLLAGLVVAAAGTSVIDEPIKGVLLITVLCVAHWGCK